ncbi:anthranilate synthase component I, putative [Babesia ovis]|uniref:Anthranilate synthase component I, putative n=1 Tax=Babesia ovis TaxID=5869 RepID=A0A9W5TDU4_BABOV|nr:anthranilate synthase component I, putative [Babesia ovis]
MNTSKGFLLLLTGFASMRLYASAAADLPTGAPDAWASAVAKADENLEKMAKKLALTDANKNDLSKSKTKVDAFAVAKDAFHKEALTVKAAKETLDKKGKGDFAAETKAVIDAAVKCFPLYITAAKAHLDAMEAITTYDATKSGEYKKLDYFKHLEKVITSAFTVVFGALPVIAALTAVF